MRINEADAVNVDKVLRYLVENDKTISVDSGYSDICTQIIPGLANAKSDVYIEMIRREAPIPADISYNGGEPCFLSSNEYTQEFLSEGGFVARFNELQEKDEMQKRKDAVDLELAENVLRDYATTKWQAKWSFIVSIAAVVIALLALVWEIFKK